MAEPAKFVSLDRVRAGREALCGPFPIGRSRDRLLNALEWGHDHVVFDEARVAEEFATDRPIQHLLEALGGTWSAQPDHGRPGSWIFQCQVPPAEAWAWITGQSAE
jgi:hypothetical protein